MALNKPQHILKWQMGKPETGMMQQWEAGNEYKRFCLTISLICCYS